MKNKGLLIGVITAIILAAIGLLIAIGIVIGTLYITKVDTGTSSESNTITIKFDTAGGDDLKNIKVRKDESTNLPTPVRDGYTFEGWYYDDTLVDDDYTFEKDITLTAKWTTNSSKTFTVSFNSNGGSKVKDIVVNCGSTLKLPSNPTRSEYKFVSWADKHGKVILNGALLTCENITLYANWEKKTSSGNNENHNTSTETNTNDDYYRIEIDESGYGYCPTISGNTVIVVTRTDDNGNEKYLCKYTRNASSEEITANKCNDGYTLSGTTCTKYTNAVEVTN